MSFLRFGSKNRQKICFFSNSKKILIFAPLNFYIKTALYNMPGWWNWYTRTSQKRMPHSLRVRVSLRALNKAPQQ